MRLVILPGIDPTQVRDRVGTATFERGQDYVRRRQVVRTEWDGAESMLSGRVRGSGGRFYETDVWFEEVDGRLALVGGACDCPMEIDCKHVAALALTAAAPARVIPPAAADPAWEHVLDALLEPERRAAALAGQRTALALQLSLLPAAAASDGRPVILSARLVKPGRTGWVGGGLSWSRLEQSYYTGEFRPDHVALLRELYALHRARGSAPGYRYGEEKAIDLAALDSVRLWSLLEEAGRLGIRLVHPLKALGEVAAPGRAELRLDVTGDGSGGFVVAALARVETADGVEVPGPRVVGFLGAGGHGLLWLPSSGGSGGSMGTGRPGAVDDGRGEDGPIGLARLATPAGPMLRRMVLAGQRLTVPAEHRARFGTDFYPRLRHLAEVTSSDGGWAPPAISPPGLRLRAEYGPGHRLELSWTWAYRVDGVETLGPLVAGPGCAADPGHRDPAAETALLDRLGADAPRDAAGAPAPSATLDGWETRRFTTEVLPRLVDEPAVEVEVIGEPARYRDLGDQLTIRVSTAEPDTGEFGKHDWFDLGVEVELTDDTLTDDALGDGAGAVRKVPLPELLRALAAEEPQLLLADGAWFTLDKPELRALRELIEEARALQDRPGPGLRISRFQAGLWDELAALGVVDRQASAWREQVDGLLRLADQPPPAVPEGLRAELRPYQRDGFAWLAFLWRHRLGGILADDMGLGKTVQALALLCHARAERPADPPFLVVAPTSVVANWAAEAARFAPGLRVVTITDTLRRRGQELADAVADADVVITTYTLLRLDVEAYAGRPWAGTLFDEAQAVKNHHSKVYAAARRLAAPVKLAITGTPMENDVMELWSLLSITAPGLFPSPTRFREQYAAPLHRGADPELLARLRRRVRPLITRRTKEKVAPELPAKQQQVLAVELDASHRRTYQRHLQRERQKVLGLLGDVQRNRFEILKSLTLLRQLALHPGLVDDAHLDAGSAKIDALVAHLDEVRRGGHRALVFSQFTGFLALVRRRLDEAGIGYRYLDGATRNRARVIESFKTGTDPAFLISLKAGGFGLNLTEADYVFLLDPWWNPATEAQAVDRTHRIGQSRTVLVYRLISTDTIEEKVLALAARKAELAAGVMDEGNLFSTTLAADDVRALLG